MLDAVRCSAKRCFPLLCSAVLRPVESALGGKQIHGRRAWALLGDWRGLGRSPPLSASLLRLALPGHDPTRTRSSTDPSPSPPQVLSKASWDNEKINGYTQQLVDTVLNQIYGTYQSTAPNIKILVSCQLEQKTGGEWKRDEGIGGGGRGLREGESGEQ